MSARARVTSVLPLLVALTACRPGTTVTTPPAPDGATASEPTAPRAWDVRIFDTGAGREVDLDAMFANLAEQEFVLVGETHLDAETHRLERVILEALADRRPGQVALSLEMFERDVQPVLDAYLAGKRDEASFLRDARPWGNYRTGYRPLVETAKAHHLPVIAANFPRPLRMKFAMNGAKALEELTPQEKAWMPDRLLPAPDAYWDRLSAQLRDHGHGGMPTTPEERLYAIQNLWDNSMASAAVAGRPADGLVVHMVGAFHIEYGLGTAAQIRARRPEAKIRTVSIVTTGDLSEVDPAHVEPRADYVVYVVGKARSSNDGAFAVSVDRELQYLLSDPPIGDATRPLLVWLADDGVRHEDELRFWERALGPDVLVAVVLPPHRQREADLRISGRWWWPDSYDQDVATAVEGIGRIIEYTTEHFGVDERRIVVAGAGTGGATALWAGLYAGADDEHGPTIVAAAPADLTRFAEASLPRAAPSLNAVTVIAAADDRKAAEETFSAAGVTTLRAVDPGASTEATWRLAENEIRRGLGLTAVPSPEVPTTEVAIAADTALAHQWARLYARATPDAAIVVGFGPQARGKPLEVDPARFADGAHLPLAAGPFGGTTVLVLPKRLDRATKKAWEQLETDDVLNRRSRFAHLAVTDEAGLRATLDDIVAKGRRNVLVIPAQFVVDAATMQKLEAAIEGHDPSMTIAWLPGLGAALVDALAQPGLRPPG